MAFVMNTAKAQSTKGTSGTGNATMSDDAMAALDSLINQLLAGGTAEQRQQAKQRTTEIDRTRQQQATYSKEAAFADAEGAMAAQLREALAALMPNITRASEGAGASQGSLRALLLQKAAQDSADSAATLGLNAATSYGQISANLAGVLSQLTAPNNTVTDSLLQALSAARGSINPNTGGGGTTNGMLNGMSIPSSWSSAGTGTGTNSSQSKSQPAYAQDTLTYYPPTSASATDSIDNATWAALMDQYGGTTDSVRKFADALGGGGWNSFLI